MLTESQELQLQAILLRRHRRLVSCYVDHGGRRVWAVSREIGRKNARDDQRHLLDLSGPELRIVRPGSRTETRIPD